MNERIVALAKELKAKNDLVDMIEAQLKEQKDLAEQINKKMLDLMETEQVTKLSVKDVGTCYIRADLKVNVIDVELLHKYLKDNGAGDLIKPYVQPMSLKAYTKERFSELRIIPDGVEVYPKSKVVIRTK